MRQQLCALSIALLLSAVANAQPQISGNVAGTYGPGEYLVVGNITLASGNSMMMLPGTTFLFSGFYRFDINGYLLAVGDPSDSIRFIRHNPDRPWKGIRFHDSSNDSSRLEYCLIAGSDSGGVRITQASPTLSRCTIRDNQANFAAGIYIYDYSSPLISHCLIQGNSTIGGGAGGVFVGWWGCYPIFADCIICGNRADEGAGMKIGSVCTVRRCRIERNMARYSGGGIYVDQSSPTIADCIIRENSADFGAGIDVCKGSPNIDHCLIAGNAAGWAGGGIADDAGGSQITHCTIVDNQADSCGSAVFVGWAGPTVVNCIIARNEGGSAVHNDGPPFLKIKYCDFHANEEGNFFNCPRAMGFKVAVNPNGDSCDVFHNIFEDPLFEDPGSNNFRLTWANFPILDSTRSSCIDAGAPGAPFDPDGTIADQGAYYFDQNPEMQSTSADAEKRFFLHPSSFILSARPNPFNLTTAISFELRDASYVSLKVYDISGRLVATLVDGWREPGVHEATFDGSALPSGIYLYRVTAGTWSETGKMILLK